MKRRRGGVVAAVLVATSVSLASAPASALFLSGATLDAIRKAVKVQRYIAITRLHEALEELRERLDNTDSTRFIDPKRFRVERWQQELASYDSGSDASGRQYATNAYGASYDAGIATYDNSGLIGVGEYVFVDPNNGAITRSNELFTLGLSGRVKRTGGWSVEPAGVLARQISILNVDVDIQDAPNPQNIDPAPKDVITLCEGAVEYVYGDANDSMSFDDPSHYYCGFGLTDHSYPASEDYGLSPIQRCVKHMVERCSDVRPVDLWSSDGQIALHVEGDTATMMQPDGTRLEFTESASTSSQHVSGLFEHDSDAAVRMDGGLVPTREVDRNGNVTAFARDADGLVESSTDPFGNMRRWVRNPDAQHEIREIHEPGPGGVDLVWRLDWDRRAWHPSSIGRPQTEAVEFSVITSITQPDLRAYTFTYEDDTGFLASVTTPDGAQIEIGWGTVDTPFFLPPSWVPGALPSAAELLLARHHTSTTVRPEGASGPAYVTRFEQDRVDSLVLGEGLERPLRWYEEIGHDTDGDGTPDYIDSELRGIDHILAHERRRGDALVEATYYANIGGLSAIAGDEATPAVGETYLEGESMPRRSTHLVDARPWRVVHVKDGVQWFEDLHYLPYDLPGGRKPANECEGLPSGIRCSSVRTTGNVVLHTVRAGDGTRLVQRATQYETGAGHLARNLLRLRRSEETRDGDGNVLARTEWRYDEDGEGSLAESGVAAARRVAVGDHRGNATTVREFVDAAKSLVTRSHYYDNGIVHRVARPKADGNLDGGYTTTTTIDFAECSSSHRVRETKVTLPIPGHGSSALHEIVTRQDCWTDAVLSTRAVDGAITCNRWDELGRLVETAMPGDTLSAGASGVADDECTAPASGATGPTTTTRYELATDGEGHSDPRAKRVVTLGKNGGSGVESIAFTDGLGRVTARCVEVDPDHAEGNRFACTRTVFDGLGRELESSVPFWVPAEPTSVPTRPTSTRFIATTYDAIGRVTSSELVGSGLGPVITAHAGDGVHWLQTTTDKNGYDTITRIDALGHVVSVDREWVDDDAGLSSACSAGFCTTSMTRDALGRLLSIAEDGGVITTSYGYDWLGRRTSMMDLDQGGFAGRVWSYEYDAHGNETSRTDPNGNTITFEYDALDRLAKKTLPEAIVGDEDEQIVTFFYDGSGAAVPE